MYDEGIIIPWRIFLYLEHKQYMYNDETKKWKMCGENYKWYECKSPLEN